ncbi:MAG TPA: flagellar export chaperone FliS [Limnochordia bacterium]
MAADAYRAYRDAQVSTATPGELLLLLYGGAIRFASQAEQMLRAGRGQEAHHLLVRTQAVVAEMSASLDFQHPLAPHLFRLYTYMNERLVEANVKKDPAPIGEVIQMLRSLREAWETVIKGAAKEAAAPSAARGISHAV